MNNKKQYIMPQFTVVELEESDIICTSNMNVYNEEAGGPVGARDSGFDWDE